MVFVEDGFKCSKFIVNVCSKALYEYSEEVAVTSSIVTLPLINSIRLLSRTSVIFGDS